MTKCKLNGNDSEATERFLLEAVELAREQAGTARLNLKQALTQISSFYKQQGKKTEAAEYKSQLLGL